jgi:hypothetical protein
MLSSPDLHWGLIGPGNITDQFSVGLKAIENSLLYAEAGRVTGPAETSLHAKLI